MSDDDDKARTLSEKLIRRVTDSKEVSDRLNKVPEIVLRRLDEINVRLSSRRQLMQPIVDEITSRSLPVVVKYSRLWKLADHLSAATSKLAACKKGCSHCCYLEVPLSNVEAMLVGKRIVREPAQLNETTGEDDSFNRRIDYLNPCTFLRNGTCSIYENRPLACRIHFNLDTDELLCRLTEAPVSVPYLDKTLFSQPELEILKDQTAVSVADIRYWFPIDHGKVGQQFPRNASDEMECDESGPEAK